MKKRSLFWEFILAHLIGVIILGLLGTFVIWLNSFDWIQKNIKRPLLGFLDTIMGFLDKHGDLISIILGACVCLFFAIFLIVLLVTIIYYIYHLIIICIKKVKEYNLLNKTKRILVIIGKGLIIAIISIVFFFILIHECSSVLIYEEYENHIPSRYR